MHMLTLCQLFMIHSEGIMSTRESPQVREEEILNACEKLYEKMNFKEITIKEIGAETSFSRPSIYNYFQTKEEIFLKLFEREYLLWCNDLEKIVSDNPSANDLPEKMARSLEKRALMLKLLAVNLYDMEENSRLERLVSFKKAYGRSISLVDELLKRTFPEKTSEERRQALIAAYQFLHGVYPYAYATKKQIEAMKEAGVPVEKKSIYELILVGLKKIMN